METTTQVAQEIEEIVETERADHSPANDLGEAPDFAAEWEQIREDLDSEAGLRRDHAAVALRIGQTLFKIHEATPHGLWLSELRKHGVSQSQASRYIRFAKMPPEEREVFQRDKWFNVSRAVGERDRRKGAATRAGDHSFLAEAEIPADEMCDWLAEVEQRVKLAIQMVELGQFELEGRDDVIPEDFADDQERWKSKVAEIADAVLAVLDEHLAAELRKRLLPGRS